MSAHQSKSNFKPTGDTMILLDRHASELVTVPKAAIMHMPSAMHKTDKYHEVCPSFSDAGRCPDGDACRYVHAYLDRCTRKSVHINWAWHALEDCLYERFPAGMTIAVREPVSANSNVSDVVESSRILKTRCVFNDANRPPTHCAHFYYGRECHIGQRCDFAHVAHVDENADPDAIVRVPPPSHFGRTRHLDSPYASRPTSSVPPTQKKVIPKFSPTTNGNLLSFPGSPRSLHSGSVTPQAGAMLSPSASPLTPCFSAAHSPLPIRSTPGLTEVSIPRNPQYHELLSSLPPLPPRCTVRSRPAPVETEPRWRHDPYSTQCSRAQVLTPPPMMGRPTELNCDHMLEEHENEFGYFSPMWFNHFNAEATAEKASNAPVAAMRQVLA